MRPAPPTLEQLPTGAQESRGKRLASPRSQLRSGVEPSPRKVDAERPVTPRPPPPDDESHGGPPRACHTDTNSETAKPDAARSGSLMHRVESIAKPAGPAWLGRFFVVCPGAREREVPDAHHRHRSHRRRPCRVP